MTFEPFSCPFTLSRDQLNHDLSLHFTCNCYDVDDIGNFSHTVAVNDNTNTEQPVYCFYNKSACITGRCRSLVMPNMIRLIHSCIWLVVLPMIVKLLFTVCGISNPTSEIVFFVNSSSILISASILTTGRSMKF